MLVHRLRRWPNIGPTVCGCLVFGSFPSIIKQRYNTSNKSPDLHGVRDAPFDIWGGGGRLEFLLLANFFFYLREKTSFFFGDQRPTIFFMFRRRIFCRMLFLLCTLPFGVFFWSTYFSSILTTNIFFLPLFSTNFFF